MILAPEVRGLGSPIFQRRDWLWAALICALLLAAVGGVFYQVYWFEFTNYDDDLYVTENVQVIRGLTLENFKWAFVGSHAFNWHPLTWFSHMLDCQVYGMKPAGHHVTGVALHAINCVLLFLLFWRMAGGLWPSAFVAALFAIHPLHVESVAWVAERKDVLSGLFFILTLGAYVAYVRSSLSPLRALAWYLAVVLLFGLGLLCKPMLVTLPCVLLLLDYWPLGRIPRDGWKAGGKRLLLLLAEKLPLLALSAASCAVTVWAQGEAKQTFEQIPMGPRMANAVVAYVTYIRQMFYPVGLASLYPHPRDALSTWMVAAAALLLVNITLAAWFLRRKCPYFLVGWLWYLGMMVPVIGLIQVGNQGMADRYTYLTQIGLYVALAWAALDVSRLFAGGRIVFAAAAVLVVAALIPVAWHQTGYWHDSETLWTRTIACTKDNAIAHNNLGVAQWKKQKFDDAVTHFEKAKQINPFYAAAYNNLANVLVTRGQFDDAAKLYQQALQLDPRQAETENNLGVIEDRRGNVDAAIARFKKATELKWDYPAAWRNMGEMRRRKGQFDLSIENFNRAIYLDPQYTEAYEGLGETLRQMGKLDDAIAMFRKALQINPDSIRSHGNLGVLLGQQGKMQEAVGQWQEILRLQPKNPFAMNSLAWIKATSPEPGVRNGEEAVSLAERAMSLGVTNEPALIDTLAAAYAEVGRYADAVSTAEQAAQMASEQKKDDLAEVIRQRLALYQAGKPFRDERTAAPRNP